MDFQCGIERSITWCIKKGLPMYEKFIENALIVITIGGVIYLIDWKLRRSLTENKMTGLNQNGYTVSPIKSEAIFDDEISNAMRSQNNGLVYT